MLEISITEIDNGFTVYLFDKNGPPELDMTVFCETFEKVLEKIEKWKKLQEKAVK